MTPELLKLLTPVPRNWRQVLKAHGVTGISRQDLWDLQNPAMVLCECGALNALRKTNIGRLTTCGSMTCAAKKLEIKNSRSRATSLRKYGVTHPSKHVDVKKRTKKTHQERYGGHAMSDPIRQAARTETNLARYGSKTPAQEPVRAAQTKERRLASLNDTRLKLTSMLLQDIGVTLVEQIDGQVLRLRHACGFEWIKEKGKQPLCPVCRGSREEQQVANMLNKLGVKRVIRNDRIQLKPYELDFFLPDQAVGIEVNGSFWHQDSLSTPMAKKTEMAAEKGIRLIHIMDFDLRAADKVESHLRHALGLTERKISARSCEVLPINTSMAKMFLQKAHFANFARAKYHLGLFYKAELIAVCSIGQPRRVVMSLKS